MKRYNLMWMPEELQSNGPTDLNKDKVKNILFMYPKRKLNQKML